MIKTGDYFYQGMKYRIEKEKSFYNFTVLNTHKDISKVHISNTFKNKKEFQQFVHELFTEFIEKREPQKWLLKLDSKTICHYEDNGNKGFEVRKVDKNYITVNDAIVYTDIKGLKILPLKEQRVKYVYKVNVVDILEGKVPIIDTYTKDYVTENYMKEDKLLVIEFIK